MAFQVLGLHLLANMDASAVPILGNSPPGVTYFQKNKKVSP
jgi:hypothetical protein